jgi:hypothetical protein
MTNAGHTSSANATIIYRNAEITNNEASVVGWRRTEMVRDTECGVTQKNEILLAALST